MKYIKNIMTKTFAMVNEVGCNFFQQQYYRKSIENEARIFVLINSSSVVTRAVLTSDIIFDILFIIETGLVTSR